MFDGIISPFVLFITSIVVLITIVVGVLRRLRFVTLINAIPGPKGIPGLGNLLQLHGNREERFGKAVKLLAPFSENGIIRVWLGPVPVILLTRINTIEPLLLSKTLIDKGFIYSFLHSWLGLGLLTSSGQMWHKQRKLLTPAFHFNILQEFLPVINQKCEILANKLDLETGKPFDIYPYISRCALDVICVSAMGYDVNAQTDQNCEYVSAIKAVTEIINVRAMKPWLYSEFLFKLSPTGRKYFKCLSTIHKFTRKVVQRRKAQFRRFKSNNNGNHSDKDEFGKRPRLAFLDLLLEYSETGNVMTDRDIQEQVDTFAFAGHDTTSIAVYWALYCVGLHPEIQEKIQEEIESVFGDSLRDVTSEDLNKLTYLNCVCKESLRICPPVPMLIRNIKEEVKLDKYTIPAGVDVIISVLGLHHSPSTYQDPYKFMPERFLPENAGNRHPMSFIPFSAGYRNCIGQKFALMEFRIMLIHILRKFKVTTLNKKDGKIQAVTEIVTRPTKDLQTRIERIDRKSIVR